MIYELSFEGHTLGYFPSEAEAVRRAGFLPKGRYYGPGMGQRRRIYDV